MKRDHFQGKSVAEHLKHARRVGSREFSELHNIEFPGFWLSVANGIKDSAFIILSMCVLLHWNRIGTIFIFTGGWLVWKMGSRAILSWAHLERVHGFIRSELWEIEHNREQEREELTEMYVQKGLTGDLLTKVVNTIMADDNKLLRVMLEEEIGLTLSSFEHPLKQSAGVGIGMLTSIAIFFISWKTIHPAAIAPMVVLTFVSGACAENLLSGNSLLKSVVWNISLGALAIGIIYFMLKL